MLRNGSCLLHCSNRVVLNEVLSLNAQEYGDLNTWYAYAVLNEVLSLNAQE